MPSRMFNDAVVRPATTLRLCLGIRNTKLYEYGIGRSQHLLVVVKLLVPYRVTARCGTGNGMDLAAETGGLGSVEYLVHKFP